MARIVSSSCPQCGAVLEVQPNVEMVQCHYCGHRSLIEWQGTKRPPTVQVQQWQIDPSFGRIAIPVARAASGALGVLIVLGVAVPLVIGGAVFALTMRRASTTTSGYTYSPPILPIPGGNGDPLGGAAGSGQKIDAPDLHKVDIADLVRQAHAIALVQEPHADKLSSVVAFQVVGGTLDTTQQNAASIDFSFHYNDPTKAPGQKDVVEGSVSVHVRAGAMEPRTMNAFYRDKALTAPKCSSKDAWAAAVKSGVPDNAVSTFHLYDNSPFSPKSPTVWSIRVDGHDEYRREIDATNCALVKSWASSTKAPKH